MQSRISPRLRDAVPPWMSLAPGVQHTDGLRRASVAASQGARLPAVLSVRYASYCTTDATICNMPCWYSLYMIH